MLRLFFTVSTFVATAQAQLQAYRIAKSIKLTNSVTGTGNEWVGSAGFITGVGDTSAEQTHLGNYPQCVESHVDPHQPSYPSAQQAHGTILSRQACAQHALDNGVNVFQVMVYNYQGYCHIPKKAFT